MAGSRGARRTGGEITERKVSVSTGSPLRGFVARTAGRLVVVGLVLGVWWYATRSGDVSSLVLPPPGPVLRALPSLLGSTAFRSALSTTTTELLLAFAMSVIVGTVIGVAVGSSQHWSEVVRPLLVWGQTVPIILLYPLCLLIFGVGSESKIVFAGVYGVFPVALSSLMALSDCPENLRLMARSFGASRSTIRVKVELGTAWPVIVSGIRLAAALDMIGVIAGQMLGSTGGLGYEIIGAQNTFQTIQVYDLMIAVSLVVLVFNGLISVIETTLLNRANIRRWLLHRRSADRVAKAVFTGEPTALPAESRLNSLATPTASRHAKRTGL